LKNKLLFAAVFLTLATASTTNALSEERRYQIGNPSQNSSSVAYEVRGVNGNDLAERFEWQHFTPLTSGRLAPGEQLQLSCGSWMELAIQWRLAAFEPDPDRNLFSAMLDCHENNFVWNQNHNLLKWQFPRQ